MATVLIVAYLLIVIAMIVVILLQRSEGGGLGMGGGGGGGGFMSARGSANLLTRTTAILGTLFMLTAIALTIISQTDRGTSSILSQAAQNPDGSRTTVLDALDAMGTNDLNIPQQPVGPVDDLVVPADENALGAEDEAPAVNEVAPDEPSVESPATEPESSETAPGQGN